jgi:hypothetical protein
MSPSRTVVLVFAAACLAGGVEERLRGDSPKPGAADATVPCEVQARGNGSSVSMTWTLDNLSAIGGHAAAVVGAPRVVQTPVGAAIEFDGKGDGLFLDANPIAGLERFTIEALIEPAADGPAEQRFLHLSESGSENRAMLETRVLPGGVWCLDTYLRHDPGSLTLVDRGRTHAAGEWHAVALTFDGTTMAHFVDRVRDGLGAVRFPPIGAGRTSIGVRQNRVSWFKGRIALVRVTAEALAAERLLHVTGIRERPRWSAEPAWSAAISRVVADNIGDRDSGARRELAWTKGDPSTWLRVVPSNVEERMLRARAVGRSGAVRRWRP